VGGNAVVLDALGGREGGVPQAVQMLRDQADLLRTTLGATDADVVLITGGSWVGVEDHAPRILADLGELCVHGVALRPASPTGLGFPVGGPFFNLPGNQWSRLSAADLTSGPVTRRLGGGTAQWRCRRVVLFQVR